MATDGTAGKAAFSYLAAISHELRTPLNAILGYSELLVEEVNRADPAQVQKDLARIHRAGRYLLGLIEEVVDVARLDAGDVMLDPQPVRLDRLIEGLLPICQAMVSQGGNRFIWTLDPDVWVRADRATLQAVIRSLINRAGRVTREGKVELVMRVVGDDVQLEVFDDGERPDAIIASTFHPLRIESASGMVPMARRVELIDGRLEMVREADRMGFRITLDRLDHDPATAGNGATGVPARGRLFVDESPNGTDLNGLRYAVSGAEAVEMARQVRPVGIEVRVGTAGEGWDALARIRSDQSLADIPLDIVAPGGRLRLDGVLTRPVEHMALTQAASLHLAQDGRSRVLIVDADAEGREIVGRVLVALGCLVDEVLDTPAALAYLDAEEPQLVVVDLGMPDGSAFAVLDRLATMDEPPAVLCLLGSVLSDLDRNQLGMATAEPRPCLSPLVP